MDFPAILSRWRGLAKRQDIANVEREQKIEEPSSPTEIRNDAISKDIFNSLVSRSNPNIYLFFFLFFFLISVTKWIANEVAYHKGLPNKKALFVLRLAASSRNSYKFTSCKFRV